MKSNGGVRPDAYYTKIDSRGRLWVNKAFRDYLGLPKGGQIDLFMNDDGHLAMRAAKIESEND